LDSVLDLFMTQVILDKSGVLTLGSKVIPAAMPQHILTNVQAVELKATPTESESIYTQ